MSQEPFTRPDPKVDQDGTRLRQGGCACGAVRFTVRGEPLKTGVCHCTLCRKFSGSAFVTYADWPPEAFSMTGEVRTYEGRSFCPLCGSRVFHLSEHQAEVMLGALDEVPSGLAPAQEGWIKRREPWLHPLAGTGQAEEDP